MTTSVANLGIDVGGSLVRMLLSDDEERRSEVLSQPVPTTYRDFLELIGNMANELGAKSPGAVACGLPGSADSWQPIFTPALPWLEGRPLRRDLELLFASEVVLGVDGHFTLLAEAVEGAAKGYRSSVLVAIGTGIGGAIMIDGRIWRGRTRTAGSWGWLPLRGGLSNDSHGAFETMASGSALSSRAAALDESMSATELVDAARDGLPFAARETTEFALILGEGLAAIASVFDPEVLIVGGGLSAAIDVLRDGIQEAMSRWASPAARNTLIVPAMLGPSAGVVGALLASQSKGYLWL